MLVQEIRIQYAAARESGDTDTIEILQAEARDIARAEAHAVAVAEADGDEAEYTHISEATFAKVYAETLGLRHEAPDTLTAVLFLFANHCNQRNDRMIDDRADRVTAIHEAGHAVIGRVLTLACGSATIKVDHDEGSAGHSITVDPLFCIFEWERRGKVRTDDAVWHARIISYMAGAEAEREILGRCRGGDGDDRYQIALMAEELSRGTDWTKLEPRLRAMTRMLVRRHRALIERVAKALLARTTLSAGRLDKLVGRSVNDVKVNAPLSLQMAATST